MPPRSKPQAPKEPDEIDLMEPREVLEAIQREIPRAILRKLRAGTAGHQELTIAQRVVAEAGIADPADPLQNPRASVATGLPFVDPDPD